MHSETITTPSGLTATIYCADCMDVLPTLGDDVFVVTDPPYGIGFKYDGSYTDKGGMDYMRLLTPLVPYEKAVLQYPEEMMKYMVPLFGAPGDCYTWCYNSNTARQSRLWGVWGRKLNTSAVKQPSKNPDDKRVKSEVASYDWCSDLQQVKNVSPEKTAHPCQVPTRLVERVVAMTCDRGATVLDPFMGSGTTGVAALRVGCNFIGIELEPKYFEIAKRRIQAEAAQHKLFA